MSNDFINSNKLVTLAELQYMLLEVLDRKEPLPGEELSRLCKEKSFNFAFAFENTLSFLKQTGIIKINENGSVTRSADENFETLGNEQALSTLVLSRAFSYLAGNAFLEKIVNHETLTIDPGSDTYTLQTDKIAANFAFIKVLLLNFKIAAAGSQSNDQLIVASEYKSFFSIKVPAAPATPVPVTAADKKPTFFISYSHKDEIYKEELRKHLKSLTRNDRIDEWNGRDILPGEDWDNEVRKKLEAAEVVLFLVSSDFMDSDYIHDVEIKKTIERHKQGEVKIIPILLRPCDYKSSDIGKYQALPVGGLPISKWPNSDDAYVNVVDEIKRILKKK